MPSFARLFYPFAMRLDRFLTQHTSATRKRAGALIRTGRVTVNGTAVTDRGFHLSTGDRVSVDHQPLASVELDPHLHLMLHKPAGVLSATQDAHQRTVLDLLPTQWQTRGLSPVGRLDKDTTGLLLLTTDGALLHRLTHPKRHAPRTYEATVTTGLGPEAASAFQEGLTLRDGTRCKPAELTPLRPDGWEAVRVIIHEGKYHQVKRMVACCGARVTSLHRSEMGPLSLDPDLAPGETRELSVDEVALLRSL